MPEISDAAAVLIGVLVGALAAILASLIPFRILEKEIRENKKIAGGQLVLQFDERLDHYREINSALRPGGKWKENAEIPTEVEWGWPEVDSYVGLFERLYVLIRDGLIDKEVAIKLYKYRVINIVSNQSILARLTGKERSFWDEFFNLCKLFDISV